MPNRTRYFAGFYRVDMAYGGPEEGGWYYDVGQLERPLKVFPSEEAAYEFANRANRLLDHLQRHKRPVSSAAYDGDRHYVEVYPDALPAYYPTETPHYE
jgi:hypothetical protein